MIPAVVRLIGPAAWSHSVLIAFPLVNPSLLSLVEEPLVPTRPVGTRGIAIISFTGLIKERFYL